MPDYGPFLKSACGPAWKRLGLSRRSGVLAPLFSVQSKNSAGVGEFPDLELLADWCRECGMSLIQLLPLNDVGLRFCPYDAESSFALEPMHLALGDLDGVRAGGYPSDLSALRAKYPSNTVFFDTGIKRDKMRLLRKMFLERPKKKFKDFESFKEEQRYWLEDYALFKVAKQKMEDHAWETWPEPLKNREPGALRRLKDGAEEEVEFRQWVQWQSFRQFADTAARVRKKKVYLIGDLPFLVARDSADTWAHPRYFKLDLSAGAPPDLYFAEGQEWGMPPYDWATLKDGGYDYLKEKLRTAGLFYDLYRLDHFVGLFRVWSFPMNGSPDRKKSASFDPAEEGAWEPQARGILSAMLQATGMLPCAEDLGTVPDIARAVLSEYAIPGMEVQRWVRDWKGSGEFLAPPQYRPEAIVTLSTHDMTSFSGWWDSEATPEDKERFFRFIGKKKALSPRDLLRAALEKAAESASIFSVQSFQDLMTFCGVLSAEEALLRINRPGLMDEKNWRLRVPRPLEALKGLSANRLLKKMHQKAGRE